MSDAEYPGQILTKSPVGETETEAPPLGIYENGYTLLWDCEEHDQWGNLKGPPVKTIEENHGENFIKIFIYEYTSIRTVVNHRTADFRFGFQLKIEKVIRQKLANIADHPLFSIEEARQAARSMIIDICKKNRAIKRIFADFTTIRYNQPELF